MNGPLADGATLTRVTTGATWSEGPLWVKDRGVLVWSDIPGNRILEVDPADGLLREYLPDAEFPNGRTLDLDGTTIQCSHGRRRIERERDGIVEIVVDRWNGVRFNSPNDVIVASDGSIWFTDPPYGIVQPHEGHAGVPEYGGCHVFRLGTDGTVVPMITDIEEPNGLAFSVDETELYVSDTSAALGAGTHHHIVAYRVGASGEWVRDRVVYEVEDGVPDGFRVDVSGRIWTSGGKAVWVLDPDGTVILRIDVPEVVGNVCFGGDDGSTLFIAATSSIYAIETTTADAVSIARATTRGGIL